jgi:hypothetical protein
VEGSEGRMEGREEVLSEVIEIMESLAGLNVASPICARGKAILGKKLKTSG